MAEVVKNKGQMRDYMRQLYLDIDTVDQALTNGQCDALLNDYYHTYMYAFDPAVIDHDPITFLANAKSHVLDPAAESASTVHNNVVRFVRATIGNQPLKKVETWFILDEQNNSAIGKTGRPAEWAIERIAPYSGNAGQYPTYKLYVYPIPDSTYSVVLWAQDEVDDLVADSDQPRLTAAETNWICRLAAADACALYDPDLSNLILRPIPQEIQAKMGVNKNFMLPRPERADKEPS